MPDKIAYANEVEAEGMSFLQVYNESRGIGTYLYKEGCYNEPVVVFMKKHPKTITAFYGCIYGGNYYVPIDSEMPEFRIERIFDNLQPKAMICDESTLKMAEAFANKYGVKILLYVDICKTEADEEILASGFAYTDEAPIFNEAENV